MTIKQRICIPEAVPIDHDAFRNRTMLKEERPFVVGLGGTMRSGSSSELALRIALSAAEQAGAQTRAFVGADLDFEMYPLERPQRSDKALDFLDAIRRADSVVISSPGYHGSLSGLIKNALDYLEDLRSDERPYLEGRAVGCIVCAAGWQATGSTLAAMRAIAHALRGWPTPFGATINTIEPVFADGKCIDIEVASRLGTVGRQVAEFAKMQARLS
jgi:FMN reductase